MIISLPDAVAVITDAADWLYLALETVGAIIIGAGALNALQMLAVASWQRRVETKFASARMTLGSWLAVALEFQLAADVLETAIAPNWTQIGKLAAIATIRTSLNYFQTRESRELAKEAREPHPSDVQRAATPKIAAR
jgi:uncharacterized membrane protein